MSVRRTIPEYFGIYFITLTCCGWMPLFQESNGYDSVYKWFDYLKSKSHFILGYVIMPNHLHALLGFRSTQGISINRIVGNGKRFMAYDIVSRLKKLGTPNEQNILNELRTHVNATERRRNKLHQVFEPSFDWKQCIDEQFIEQKLQYIHDNPCRGKWNLATQPWNYIHSSAKQYILNEQGYYPITPYVKLKDIDLTGRIDECIQLVTKKSFTRDDEGATESQSPRSGRLCEEYKLAQRRVSGMKSTEELETWFELVSWSSNSSNDLVLAMWVGFDPDFFEERVLDLGTGKFGECLGSGRL